MELIRGQYNLQAKHRHCVATIGNFDGLHKGHQQVLQCLVKKAQAMNLPSTVILFEPQPAEYFLGDKAAARLMRLREKLPILEAAGIDRVLVLHFNDRLANMSADRFIDEILIQGLQLQYLLVGDDFRFGHQRQGDFALLQQASFTLESFNAVEQDNERVSSTRVRQALTDDNFALAESLLGCCYSMCGRVAHGHKRGRMIGFPTANIYLHRQVSPVHGVFAVRVSGLEETPVMGVANVGNRPTVDGSRTLLEIHLFDFDRDIYGHYVKVEFLHKLRDEKKYDSFELLKQQIFRDAEQAREYFLI